MADHTTKMPSQRQLRVGEQIRHILSEIFLEGSFYEPALRGISVTVPEVRVTPDLKTAVVYVSALGQVPSAEFIPTLGSIASQLRAQVAGRINLRYMPRLLFKLDESFEYAKRINDLLEESRRRDDANNKE